MERLELFAVVIVRRHGPADAVGQYTEVELRTPTSWAASWQGDGAA